MLDELCGMASVPPPRAQKEILDDLDDRWKLLRHVTGFGIVIIACLLVFLDSELIRTRWARPLFWCWCGPLLASGILCLPFFARDWLRAFRHEPALRMDDRGIWSRAWSSAGIIEWVDVRALYTGRSYGLIVVILRNEEKYLRRFGWTDSLNLAVTRFWSALFRTRPRGAFALCLAVLSIDQLSRQAKAVIDPLLAAHGLPPLGPRSAT